MGGSCKGKCELDPDFFVSQKNGYIQGYKRCTTCELFTKSPGPKCPCCNRILKIKSTANRYKQRQRLAALGIVDSTIEINRKIIISKTDGTYEVVDANAILVN